MVAMRRLLLCLENGVGQRRGQPMACKVSKHGCSGYRCFLRARLGGHTTAQARLDEAWRQDMGAAEGKSAAMGNKGLNRVSFCVRDRFMSRAGLERGFQAREREGLF